MSKTRKLSLNDFYKATPGATPLETLPSKPGETARINDVPYTDLGVSSKFSGGQKTYAGFSADLYNGSSRGYGGPLGYSGNAYENNNRNQVSYAAPRGDWGSAQHQYDHPPPQRYDQDGGRADRQSVQGVPREYGFMPAGTLGGYGGFGGSSMPPPPPPPPRQQQLQLSSAGAATPAAPEPEVVAAKPAAGPPRATKVPASELGRALANTAQLVDRPAPASQVQPTSIPQRKGPEDLWEQASGRAMSQQSCSPKNEWAEKMAQAALSKLSTGGIKSSLLSSSPALGDAISHPTPGAAPLVQHLHTGAGSIPPPAAKPSDSPPTEAVLAEEQAEEQQRPRLNLLPRTKPALDITYPVPAADAAAAANGGARPKLNLLPRSKPATADNGDTGSHKPSIFGSARPREEVLKERGVDPALADLEAERHRQAQLHAALGVEHPRHSGPAFAASGFSEEPAGGDLWQTVGGGVRGGAKASLGQFDDMNPFFGGIGAGGYAGAARPVPSARTFGGSSYEYGQEIGGRNSHGNSYGSPACREGAQFGGFAYPSVHQEDDGPMFKRSLPTRQDFII